MTSVFERSELDKILNNYLFYSGSVDSFQKIPQGLYNNNYRIKIGKLSWVIKFYPSSANNSRTKLSHQLQSTLYDNGFPLAKLETTKDQSFFVEKDDSFYTVHQWVEGKHLSPLTDSNLITNAAVTQIACSLAKMHRIVSSTSFVPPDEINAIHWERLFSKSIEQCSSLMHRRSWHFSRFNSLKLKWRKSNFDGWIIDRLPFFLEIAKKLNDEIFHEDVFVNGNEIPIHNDINWENIIFDSTGDLLAYIDFDNSIYADRLYEVGAAAIVISGSDELKLKVFIEAYNDAFGEVCSDRVIYAAMVIKCLNSILFSINSYLKGKIKNYQMLESWCLYLEKSLESILTCHRTVRKQ
ncbi:phosphotransferase [uncultured Desulfuromusa sp.]|uniref:phosphotransferase n=1 Tax=uncultured Desulfuromusa sp. TaxID=219183 RepID=UPI002AA65A2C|nr:phosphotransferase [uncultured Desulfuromusa sp.]